VSLFNWLLFFSSFQGAICTNKNVSFGSDEVFSVLISQVVFSFHFKARLLFKGFAVYASSQSFIPTHYEHLGIFVPAHFSSPLGNFLELERQQEDESGQV
jgi:hypothetical protein